MPPAKKSEKVEPIDVAYFVPNIIGYARIFLALAAFAVAKYYPSLFLIFYTVSFILDAADGMAARALDQCSYFGAILDMLTDRASTAGFLVVLDHAMQPMPEYFTFICASLVFLDVASHFCRTYVSLFLKKKTHKDVSDSIFTLLRVYYSNRRFMGALCVGQEFSYIFLFAHAAYGHVNKVSIVLQPLIVISIILCALKQVVNVQQLVDGLYHLAVLDAEEHTAKKEGNKKE